MIEPKHTNMADKNGGIIDQLVAVDDPNETKRTLDDMWDCLVVSENWKHMDGTAKEASVNHYRALRALLEQIDNPG